jgi:hypothetical protein
MSSQIKFLAIIEKNPQITKPQIAKYFTHITASRFNYIIRVLAAKDWIITCPEPGFAHQFPRQMEQITYKLAPNGRKKLQSVREANKTPKVTPLQARRIRPDYIRIRRILNAPIYMSNLELAELWNDVTDFYLPYGNSPLQPIF